MAITINTEQSAEDVSRKYIIHVTDDEMLGKERWNILVKASYLIVDELVKEFKPQLEEEFRKSIPKLVKQMGNELIVKGLKQLAKEDSK